MLDNILYLPTQHKINLNSQMSKQMDFCVMIIYVQKEQGTLKLPEGLN